MILAHHRMWRDAEAAKVAPAPIVADIEAPTASAPASAQREVSKTAQHTQHTQQPQRAQR